jgi:aromatic ring-opening dioxygenase LigB subunit
MSLIFAAMAPHGFTVIPEMSDDAEGALKTRTAMQDTGRRGRVAKGRQIEQSVPFDQPFAGLVAETAKASGAPVVMGSYAGGGVHGVLPLDWGTITPLWFAAFPHDMPGHGDVLAEPPAGQEGPTVVTVCPARNLRAEQLIIFGRALAEAAEQDGRRIAYIASCDWAHTHSADGPYGFSEAAAPADAKILSAMKNGDLSSLAAVTAEEVKTAAMDGLAQTLILAGVIEATGLRHDVLSYEVPTYYGMIVATYS